MICMNKLVQIRSESIYHLSLLRFFFLFNYEYCYSIRWIWWSILCGFRRRSKDSILLLFIFFMIVSSFFQWIAKFAIDLLNSWLLNVFKIVSWWSSIKILIQMQNRQWIFTSIKRDCWINISTLNFIIHIQWKVLILRCQKIDEDNNCKKEIKNERSIHE